MRDHQHGGRGLVGDPAQQGQHLGLEGRAQRGKRLVQQQHGARPQQHPGQGDAALLAARQAGGAARVHPLQPDLGESLRDAGALGFGQAQVGAQAKAQVLRHRQMRKQVLVLEQHRHRTPPRRQGGDVGAVQPDPAAIRRQKPRDQRQKRGFPRSRRADHRHPRARRDGQVGRQAEMAAPQVDALKLQQGGPPGRTARTAPG